MIEYWVRDVEVPPKDRVEYWRELLIDLWGSVEISSAAGPEVLSEWRTLDLGGLAVGSSRLAQFGMRRTAAHVRRDDPEIAVIGVTGQGWTDFELHGRQDRVGPGNLLVYHTSAPFSSSSTPTTNHLLQFPRALLPPVAEQLLGTELSGTSGLGALVAGALREAAALPVARAAEAARLASITLDLFTTLCLRELQASRPPATAPAVLLAEINAFIQRHLADPDLSPATIAAAHHISVRYLHRLFQQQEATVAGRIRELRLENCRHDLADPALRERPAHVVGRRWGFTDSAHFNRAFRATYGLPPGEYRKLVQTGGHAGPKGRLALGEA